MKNEKDVNLSRRRFIINSTGGGFAALLLACGSKQSVAGSLTGATVFPRVDAKKVCALTKEMTEGPFYIEGATVRKNIRDGSPGKNLLLRLQVVDAARDCRPVRNAVVSIWHCNATGIYSGYENMNPGSSRDGMQGPPNGMPPGSAGRRPPMRDANGMPPPPPRDANGRMMPPPGGGDRRGMPRDGRGGGMHENPSSDRRELRGVQITDERGFVEFETVYPGWYAPRAVHIHTKIFLNDREMLTTQLFFPEELNEQIFSTLEPYKTRGVSPFKNAGDGIAGSNPPLLEIKEESDTMIGTIIIGMQSA